MVCYEHETIDDLAAYLAEALDMADLPAGNGDS